jgi:hypothetical protein
MLEPMAATNRVIFRLEPRGTATDVTWHMEGTNGFVGKAMSLVMSMDRMIGDEFAKGLAALKAQVESGSQAGS